MFEARGGLKATKYMLVDEQVAMFLYILAHNVKNRIIKRQFSYTFQKRITRKVS
jgi:hypothetical protein